MENRKDDILGSLDAVFVDFPNSLDAVSLDIPNSLDKNGVITPFIDFEGFDDGATIGSVVFNDGAPGTVIVEDT